jgi:hypothetical protein
MPFSAASRWRSVWPRFILTEALLFFQQLIEATPPGLTSSLLRLCCIQQLIEATRPGLASSLLRLCCIQQLIKATLPGIASSLLRLCSIQQLIEATLHGLEKSSFLQKTTITAQMGSLFNKSPEHTN